MISAETVENAAQLYEYLKLYEMLYRRKKLAHLSRNKDKDKDK